MERRRLSSRSNSGASPSTLPTLSHIISTEGTNQQHQTTANSESPHPVYHRRTSNNHASPTDPSSGQTLWDFLRNSELQGPAQTTSQSSEGFARAREDFNRRNRDNSWQREGFSHGRKRTSTTSDGSDAPRPNPAGSSATNPIDLTSPERPRRSYSRTQTHDSRRPRQTSDIVLPTWQPDSEVLKCPVCDRQFSFWYRKHHCRKCGRVVCTNCSPHRITIPRQFIVQPPVTTSLQISTLAELADNARDSSHQVASSRGEVPSLQRRSSYALGGGEVVRVCNPCVPDPNLSPPPQQAESPHSARLAAPPEYSRQSQPPRRSTLGHAFAPSSSRPLRIDPLSQGSSAVATSGRDHVTGLRQDRASATGVSPSSMLQAIRGQSSGTSHVASSSRSLPLGPATFAHRRTINAVGSRAGLEEERPRLRHARPPRPQVLEEDECPVCGRELPPKRLDGSEEARVAHVEFCIRLYSSSIPTSQAPAANPATASTGDLAMLNAVGEAASPQRRATGNRMLVYHATEKDCMSEDGQQQECVICFEEFEEGDEMGRLECLCKFHRSCIRKWWEQKGSGSCPTHQLQL